MKTFLKLVAILIVNINLFANDFDSAMEEYNKSNYTEAMKLFQKSCDSGNNDGCNNIGLLYIQGKGVNQDYSKAIEQFQKACDGGNGSGCFNLGIIYEKGKGVNQDYTKAIEVYKKACDNGNYS